MAFGAADVDLRKAIIDEDVELNVDVAFGGLTDNRLDKSGKGSPVIFIKGKAAFGGVEIR